MSMTSFDDQSIKIEWIFCRIFKLLVALWMTYFRVVNLFFRGICICHRQTVWACEVSTPLSLRWSANKWAILRPRSLMSLFTVRAMFSRLRFMIRENIRLYLLFTNLNFHIPPVSFQTGLSLVLLLQDFGALVAFASVSAISKKERRFFARSSSIEGIPEVEWRRSA